MGAEPNSAMLQWPAKIYISQVEELIEKETQNVSKLQVLGELQREATEIAEEQCCRLEEARLNLITPFTSEAETSEAEKYGVAGQKGP